MPKMTVERAVKLKREIGRRVHEGGDDDYDDYSATDFDVAIVSELLDAIAYADRQCKMLMRRGDTFNHHRAGWSGAMVAALENWVEIIGMQATEAAIAKAAAAAGVDLSEIEAAVDGENGPE